MLPIRESWVILPLKSRLHLVASRYNNFVADTTLYGGTLLLEHGAVFGRNLEDMRNLGNDSSSLTVEKGTLEIIGGSTANAAAFSLSGRDAVLRPGDSAFINANTADFSRGFTFDMRHQLQSGPGSGPGLTLSAAQSFTAGGLIGVADTGSNAPYFYADRSWKQDRVFHVLTDAEHTLQGNFDGVVSQATGTDRVDSPLLLHGNLEPPVDGRRRRRLRRTAPAGLEGGRNPHQPR